MKTINYRATFSWDCPDCRRVNYLTARPRKGKALVCGSGPMDLTRSNGGCGAIHVAGRRVGGDA